MDENQVEGVVKQGVGHIQDGVGGLTGDDGVQLKGKVNEAAGALQGAYGKIKDQTEGLVNQAQAKAQDVYGAAEQFTQEQPLAAVGVGAAIGFGLGILVGVLIAGQSRPTYFAR